MKAYVLVDRETGLGPLKARFEYKLTESGGYRRAKHLTPYKGVKAYATLAQARAGRTLMTRDTDQDLAIIEVDTALGEVVD